MGAFDLLARPVQKWVRAQGWTELRDVQARAIETIHGKEADVIIAAATAGGKTEAAFLPLVSEALQTPQPGTGRGFDILYVGPLRALINDQHQRLQSLCVDAEIEVTPWHGDVSQSVKGRAMKSPSGVLLITPESLEALFVRRGPMIPGLFGGVRAVVVDELHTLLDSDRGVHLRSLLTRLELAASRRIRRIGLSATLGDMDLARVHLRPEEPDAVHLLEAQGGDAELRVQLRGYLSGGDAERAAEDEVARHLFEKLRGANNLVFAGARQNVEAYTDRLARRSEAESLPQEFYAHHANLSKEHREFVEHRLKEGRHPTTAVCTSTLELGIDIGDVECVAQVGAPFTVAGLRQRLGRSGRREGKASVLRQYAVEAKLDRDSNIVDRLRLGLVRSVAMIDLLIEGWCEPPRSQSLHLSTLVHQILSVVAERGGASAKRLYVVLCEKGPFTAVTQEVFLRVLRRLGEPDIGLLEQADDGTLLLGGKGEKLVEHYSFYAVFMTPEEYRVLREGSDIGTLPVDNVLAKGMTIILSGRRWEVLGVDDIEKVITVTPSAAGRPPVFGGDPGDVHDRVINRMKTVFEEERSPVYLDDTARELLGEARREYERLGLRDLRILKSGAGEAVLATWAGTTKTWTLGLVLGAMGFKWTAHDGLLEISSGGQRLDIRDALQPLAAGAETPTIDAGNLMFEKFHAYLGRDLLMRDAQSSRLEVAALPGLAQALLVDAEAT